MDIIIMPNFTWLHSLKFRTNRKAGWNDDSGKWKRRRRKK